MFKFFKRKKKISNKELRNSFDDITIEITDGENQSFYSSDSYYITTDQDDEGKLIIKIYR